MSQQPPIVMSYESARAPASSLWPAVRVGVIVYAAAIVVRHGLYWTAIASTFSPATLVALGEVGVLVAMAVVAIRHREPTPAALRLLATLGLAMIGLAVAGLGVELFATTGFRTFLNPIRLLWLIATRAATVAIPVVLVVAGRRA